MAKEVAVEWNELSSDLVGVIVRFHGQMDRVTIRNMISMKLWVLVML